MSSNGSSVAVTGVKKSAQNEVGIQVSSGGQHSAVFHLTVLVPDHLDLIYYRNLGDANYAYSTLIQYKVMDNLGNVLPANLDMNEHFTTGLRSDYSSCPGGATNWIRGPEQPSNDPPGDFEDSLQGQLISGNYCPSPSIPTSPTYLYDGTQLEVGTKVSEFDGGFWAGSQTAGVGYEVQSQTWTRWLDHATHENRVTPTQ